MHVLKEESARLVEYSRVSARQRLWLALAIATLGACSALWLHSDAFPGGNNVFHIPIVLHYADSAEGPHDAFTRSLDNFASLLWPAVASITTEENVRVVFLMLLLGTAVLTVLGGFAVAAAAGSDRILAAIGCAVLAFGFAARVFMELGSGELFSGFLTHSQVALAVGLFAVAAAIRRRWCLAGAVCGIAADMNLFLGFWLMVNLSLARAAIDWRNYSRPLIKSYVCMAGSCLLLASPAIIWALQTSDAASAKFSFVEFLYSYFPYHSFIHLEIWLFLASVALNATVAYGLCQDEKAESAVALGLLTLTATITIFIGGMLVYLVDHRMVQNLYPLRYAAFAHWLAAVGAVVLWSRAANARSESAPFGAIAVLGFTLPTPAVTLFALGFLIDASKLTATRRWLILLGLAVSLVVPAFSEGRVHFPELTKIGQIPALTIVTVAGAAALSFREFRNAADRWLLVLLLWLVAGSTTIGDRGVAVAFAGLTVGMAAIIHAGRGRRWALACGTSASLLLLLHVFSTGFSNWTVAGSLVAALLTAAAAAVLPMFEPRLAALRRASASWSSAAIVGSCVAALSLTGVSVAARRGFDFPQWQDTSDWTDAQRWARENTAPDTLFYAPDRFAFATMSRRPVWYDPNEGAAVMWDSSFYAGWNQRRRLAETAKDLSAIVTTSRNEGVRFLVLERKRFDEEAVPGLAIRYCNATFCIAEISSP